MSVTSINSTDSSSTAAGFASRVPQKVLGQKDFLKLIATQMTHQDPMKPMEDTAFIAQMAQFSSLENSQKMLDQFSTLRSSGELSLARSLIGQSVTVWDGENEKNVTGAVDGVDMSGGKTSLVIGGKTYEISNLRSVGASPLPTADEAAAAAAAAEQAAAAAAS